MIFYLVYKTSGTKGDAMGVDAEFVEWGEGKGADGDGVDAERRGKGRTMVTQLHTTFYSLSNNVLKISTEARVCTQGVFKRSVRTFIENS